MLVDAASFILPTSCVCIVWAAGYYIWFPLKFMCNKNKTYVFALPICSACHFISRTCHGPWHITDTQYIFVKWRWMKNMPHNYNCLINYQVWNLSFQFTSRLESELPQIWILFFSGNTVSVATKIFLKWF